MGRHAPLSVAALALALGGCMTSTELEPAASAPVVAATTPAAPTGLRVYLESMQQLIAGDPLARASAFNDAERAAEFAPTTTNRLRYALALSVPGHGGSDAAAASERLSALLAAGDTLLPEERMLAMIQLRQVEQLQILATANAELTRRIETAVAENDAERAESLRTVLAENERLRNELEDATTMLEAITTIERSISESEVQ